MAECQFVALALSYYAERVRCIALSSFRSGLLAGRYSSPGHVYASGASRARKAGSTGEILRLGRAAKLLVVAAAKFNQGELTNEGLHLPSHF